MQFYCALYGSGDWNRHAVLRTVIFIIEFESSVKAKINQCSQQLYASYRADNERNKYVQLRQLNALWNVQFQIAGSTKFEIRSIASFPPAWGIIKANYVHGLIDENEIPKAPAS